MLPARERLGRAVLYRRRDAPRPPPPPPPPAGRSIAEEADPELDDASLSPRRTPMVGDGGGDDNDGGSAAGSADADAGARLEPIRAV